MRSIQCCVIKVVILAVSVSHARGQTLKPRPPAEQQTVNSPAENSAATPVIVPMSVPAGTPIKVALNSEVRIKGPGQAIHGKTTDPVFVFDKLLIPAGTAVNGKIGAIDGVPKKIRTLTALCRSGRSLMSR